MAGIEPARFIQPQDFKSCASASSATSAFIWTDKNYCTTFYAVLSIVMLKKIEFNCIYVNDVKQSLKKNHSILNLQLYATANSSSALFSFGVKYPNTAIGILFDLFKYAFPCFIKSSKL